MKNYKVEAIIVAVSLLCVGIFIYAGFKTFAEKDRSVLVKGFSERIVKANTVTWSIPYRVAGNNLQQLYKDVDVAQKNIISFLTKAGIPDSCINIDAPRVIDHETETYVSPDIKNRFNIQAIVTIATDKVDVVRDLQNRMQELLSAGVIISSDYEQRLIYNYTLLDKIKPQMIEEATKNAREAAEKFAKDSESNIGKIKKASQGYFSIDDRDSHTPFYKRIKVVTTVEYYLKN